MPGLVFPGAGGSGEACRAGDCCPWLLALHVMVTKGVLPGPSPDTSTHTPPTPREGAGRAGGGCGHTSGGAEAVVNSVSPGSMLGSRLEATDAPVDTCFRRASSSTHSLVLPCRPGRPGESRREGSTPPDLWLQRALGAGR